MRAVVQPDRQLLVSALGGTGRAVGPGGKVRERVCVHVCDFVAVEANILSLLSIIYPVEQLPICLHELSGVFVFCARSLLRDPSR